MRINVIHALPRVSSAYGKDFDGFTAALDVIAEDHDVRWLNVHPANPDWAEQAAHIAEADFVLVRSDWGWYPDQIAARRLYKSAVPCGLVIAGSHEPPSLVQARRYDVLFYETPWYRQFINQELFAIEAFGVDARFMLDAGCARDIDWLMVGRLADFKRPLRLLEKTGHRVAVGDFAASSVDIRAQLSDDGVQLVDHVVPQDLADLYNRAQNVLVPCELQGGGERAVIEGRACGCAIEVADDNPKLQSLLTAELRDHHQYAALLLAGISAVMAGKRVSRRYRRQAYLAMLAARWADKLKRSPQTIRIRWGNAMAGLKKVH